MQAIPNDDRKKLLRAYGQAATFIGLSLSFVARTIHDSQIAIGVGVASVVVSLTGLALVFKGARPERRVSIVLTALAALLAAAVCTFVMLRR